MPAPRSEQQSVMHRGRARPLYRRNINDDVWENFHSEIKRLYLGLGDDEPHCLNKLIVYFRDHRQFEPTLKQWKTQLSKWGLKKNLNLAAAAVICFLHRDAEQRNIQRRVYFNAEEVSVQKTMVYLKKKKSNDEPKTEEQLLERVPVSNQWPKSVTWSDGHAERPELFSQDRTFQDSCVQGNEPRSHQPIETPQAPPPSSAAPFDAFGQPWVILNSAVADQPSVQATYEPFGLVENDLVFANESDPAFSFCGNQHGIDNGSAFEELWRPHSYVQSHTSPVNPLEQLGSMMSSTPVAFQFAPQTDSTQWSIQLLQFVQVMLGTKQDLDDKPSNAFVKHCCEACIYAGQELAEDGRTIFNFADACEEAVQSAVRSYEMIMQQEYDESLNVLNFSVILLDAFGHMKMARNILQRLRRVVVAPTSVSGSLIAGTIDFMIDATEWGDKEREKWAVQIRELHIAAVQSAGAESRLAIATQYNQAWVLLEVDREEEALAVLKQGRPICESLFGRYHLQTISWVNSESRALLYTKNETSAEALFEEVIQPRVEKAFTQNHPLYWMMKYRQGLYLLRFADNNSQPYRRQECWKVGSDLLRDVLLWRGRVLGMNNPQTALVLDCLGWYLEKQGKEEEAANLRRWCIQSIEIYT